MAKETVLIIEDDPDIVELLQYNLEREGYRVLTAEDGEVGLREVQERKPGMILLDLMMPGIDGLEVCRQIKSDPATTHLPLIMLTAKSEEIDIVTGLELGADDYITKPFSPREVISRVRAVLRRGARAENDTKTRIEIDSVVADSERHEVSVDGKPLAFTRTEFSLLWTLMKKPGRVYTRSDLVDRITDGEGYILERNIDVHISAIRKKLTKEHDVIATVHGVGYKCRD